jgi:hypothetical protein
MAVLSVITVVFTNPFIPMMPPVLANPFIPMILSMLVNPFFAMVEFVMPQNFVVVPVIDRPMINPTVLMLGVNPLFRTVLTIVFSATVGPGSGREYKQQPCDQHTDFQ